MADLTGLDVIGIPVFQAVRPNARTLSVSQGKGVTPELARASAAMEAIELWHAEEMPPASTAATVAELADELPYSVFDLPLAQRSALSADSRLRWSPATPVGGVGTVWVPQECVRLGRQATAAGRGRLPLFRRSSNGLASGNTPQEALLHALYEVMERDACARVAHGGADADSGVHLESVSGTSHSLLERFAAADIDVRIRDLTPTAGLPCYGAEIRSHAVPLRFGGYGCHRDPDVALCRALTEAAQSRLTLIAGAREDIPAEAYDWLASCRRLPSRFGDSATSRSFPGADPVPRGSFADDLRLVVEAMRPRCPDGVYWVDLTHQQFGIPVVKVIAPGMLESTL